MKIYRLHQGGGHHATLKISETSSVNGRRMNCVTAKILIVFGGQKAGLPNEILMTPWGDYPVYKRENKGAIRAEFLLAYAHVPVGLNRLGWMQENYRDQTTVDFIRELLVRNIPIDIVKNLFNSYLTDELMLIKENGIDTLGESRDG